MTGLTCCHGHYQDNNKCLCWPPSKRRKLIYFIACYLFTLLTGLAIVINGADCLTSIDSQSSLSTSDRVFVIHSAPPSDAQGVNISQKFRDVFDNITIQVKENTPIGTKLTDIQAVDHDIDRAKILYAIVGGADQQSFTLRVDDNTNKVELVNLINFDYESPKKTYFIVIRATSLFIRYDLEVKIQVTDENDNRPQLSDFAIVFNNYKNNFPTGIIGRVPASDADVSDQLRYKVLSGNNAQLVVVNETSGDIQLSPWLNSNVPMKAVIIIAVSDGVNEEVAQLVLTINLVTEVMLQNSVMLRLEGVGREEFFTKKYEIFLHQMAKLLGSTNMYGTNNIVVFDVEESVQETSSNEALTYRPFHGTSILNSSLSVNISFSARADGNDVESYLRSSFIEDRINSNRAQLMQALEVNVAPFQESTCIQELCPTYQECQPIYKFERAPKVFVNSRNLIFRQIKTVQSYACSCPRPNGNSSSCGPCNCDESKGFDPECDKSTGQCFCKPNHYQQVGSEYCLPCDCYSIGSLGAACNQTTGQCKCRLGVVGRRCDSCASSFAEVTLRGCEVIYDGCPKTFSDGIWWDKTETDRMAKVQCPPSTSTGTAERFCHKTEGWQKPNLFDCISNTFTDLYNQYTFIEANKFPLTSALANKIASNLRQALNETITNPANQLYGSDMYISFRLIHHLIQHESQQTGLNLTHRQDRMYIRNLAESINYILDPDYAENWQVIATRSPYVGAEYLLKLIDIYGRVLIESQPDTFTQPFEVSTKYFTFGMDTISTDTLWDLSKSNPMGTPISSPPYATDPFGPPVATVDQPSISTDHQSRYNNDGSSIYLDYSLGKDASPAVTIPKYDNYPPDSISTDDPTRALIPLKTLRIKTMQELMPSSYYQAKSRAKREELIIPEFKFIRQPPALVAYSIFRSLGPLLPSYKDNTIQHKLGLVASSPVVWLTIRSTNGTEFLSKNLNPKVNYVLKLHEPTGKTRPQCAVWDFTHPSTAGIKNQSTYGYKQTGRFTTKGCELKGIHPNHKMRFKYDYVNCSCDHLGAVTVLMDSANYDYVTGDRVDIKDTVFMFALSISICLLIAASIVLSCVRGHSIKSNSNSINKNLLFILIIIELLILYSVVSRSSLSQREYQCKLIAVFLHYFSISLFLWLLVNAIHFYRMLTELRDINHGPMKFYHVLGYAVPAFFVSIAVGLRIENFGNYMFCWLSIHDPIIWSMFGPISIVTVLIILIFLSTFCRSLRLKEDLNGADLLKNHMLINIIKTPLIGMYWITTVYVVNEALVDNFYLFPAFAILKSLALFVLLCIVDKHSRYNLYVSWLRFRGEKVPFAEDSMNYSSNQWIPPMMNESGTMGKHYGYPGYSGQVTTPGFQSSCTDIFKPEVLAFSAASTTSRSTATGTSSSAYRYDHHGKDVCRDNGYERTRRSRHRRRHKKSHHKHHHHKHHHHHHHHRSHRHRNDDHYDSHYDRRRYDTQPMDEVSNSQNDLASSHSSDRDDVSTLPKKTFGSGGKVNLGATVSETSMTAIPQSGDIQEEEQQEQTVPMELSAPSTSGLQGLKLNEPEKPEQSNA